MVPFPKHILTPKEKKLFERLSTPEKIQDYLNTLPFNDTDSVQSIRRSIKAERVHCFEGALFAAALLWYHGHEPLLLDLATSKHDSDHVVALFKRNNLWGALSATHHSVLRYRDPIYKSMREIALSYFHEYFLHSGVKTMHSYSKKPFSLIRYGERWLIDDAELYDIGADLNDAPHELVAPLAILKKLRKADPVEREAGKLLAK